MNWYAEPWKKFAEFNGRSRRTEYWMFFLGNLLIGIVLGIVDSAAGLRVNNVGILGTVFSLAALIPGIAVAIRRLHDTSRSGLWLLIAFVPCIGVFILLFFFVQDSAPGSNEFGPNPKEQDDGARKVRSDY
jgi:uncharacterized membrane protein YhaH (DUF805 family)